jgi:outer membrane immunogenic protein
LGSRRVCRLRFHESQRLEYASEQCWSRSRHSFTGDEKESGAWYVGARIGYLVTPNLLTYWDGGWTQTRFDQVNFSFTNGVPLGSPTFLPATTYHGWFLGGGTEYALNFSWLPIRRLFWRNEYRYASYQAEDVAVVTSSIPPFSERSRKYVQTITSSLVWRFNGW